MSRQRQGIPGESSISNPKLFGGANRLREVNTSTSGARHPGELSKGANGTLLFPGRDKNENVLLVSEKPVNKAQQRITEA